MSIRTETVPPKLNFKRKLSLIAIGLQIMAVHMAIGQKNAPEATTQDSFQSLKFDVATVKLNKSGSFIIQNLDPPSDGFAVKNMPLKMLISNAYGVREDLVSGGPDWIDSDHYDVQAKVIDSNLPASQKLNESQRNQMVRSLLSDRFRLVVHSETKELPVYELVLAKNGLTLQESKLDQRMSYGANAGDIKAESTPISTLVELLSMQLRRTIVDKTGLAGKYDFELRWETDQGRVSDDSSSSGLPSLFTAIQEQLGLKLQSARGPVQTLIIDHVEKPSEN